MWIHDISQSMLAAAVVALGLVIMLELRSIARLRRLVDSHFTRIFEQLELLRHENQQLLEAQSPGRRPSASSAAPMPATAPTPAAAPTAVAQRQFAFDRPLPSPEVPAPASAATTGEVRLLASLAAARARRELA
jgi:hypothetical protein